MRKGYVLCGVLAALLGAGAASADVLQTSVSATGSYNGDLGVVRDGNFPANGSAYNLADKVNFTAAGNAAFRFDFGKTVFVDSLKTTVDNNDFYTFSFFDGANLVGLLNIGAAEGVVGNGVETFTRFFAPTQATSVVVTASGGDSLYALGEAQFYGVSPGGVPEPATWAMMIAGFGLAGAAARRRGTVRAVAA
jgi:hypothetical protein